MSATDSPLRLTFLGTGTSTGVPVLGCGCAVCTSDDPRDRRLRCSALLETPSERILIDCGPDFREQMLRLPYGRLDAVLITHEHFDHVGGLDDLRPFCDFGPVHIYGDALCLQHIRQRIPYCFAEKLYPGVPHLCLHEVEAGRAFCVGNTTILPVRVCHGALPILAYRIGPLVYATDLSDCPSESMALLEKPRCLVVDGLRHTDHHSHFTIEQACRFAGAIGAERTYITHLAHTAGRHADATLPQGVHYAYDGLSVDVG